MDAGHGGQVLILTVTRSLLDGTECLELGEYELKGLAEPERIFQVGTMTSQANPNVRLKLSFMPGDFETFDVGVGDETHSSSGRRESCQLTCTVQPPVTLTRNHFSCATAFAAARGAARRTCSPSKWGTKSIYVQHSKDPAPLLVRRSAF